MHNYLVSPESERLTPRFEAHVFTNNPTARTLGSNDA